MSQTYDSIIIGAGISGAAIALELSQKGYRTLNVEKLGAAGHGSTANTCAIIRTHYSTLETTALAYDSYFYWKNWKEYIGVEDELGLAKFNRVGGASIFRNGMDLTKYTSLHDALGIPYEIWDLDELARRMPHLVLDAYYPPKNPADPDFDAPPRGKVHPKAMYWPNNGYINDPVLSVHNVQRAAEAKGATFLFNAEVADILKRAGRVTGVALTDGRTIEAPVVVNASGPHSFVINRMAGVADKMKIKTRALRHEVHFVPSPPEFSYEKDGLVFGDQDLGGYHRPETGNMILVGSEDPACDGRDWIDDPDDYNRDVTTRQWQAQVYRLGKRIPNLPIPGHPKGIADLYDVSDDWVPIYDKSDLKGFYLAVGTSGNQYKNGPVIGQVLAEIIDACENGRDQDTEPVEVALRNIDFTVNTRIFSRNRDIIANSTFSVLG